MIGCFHPLNYVYAAVLGLVIFCAGYYVMHLVWWVVG
jgi:hypothetical protein